MCSPLIPRQLARHLDHGCQSHVLQVEASGIEGPAVGHKLRGDGGWWRMGCRTGGREQ